MGEACSIHGKQEKFIHNYSRDWAVNTPDSYSGGLEFNSRRSSSVHSGIFCYSALKLGYDRFLRNCFRFIIH